MRLLRAGQRGAPPLNCGVMPHSTGLLLDPAEASDFIAGYKRVLLHVAGGDPADGRDLLETLVDARRQLTEKPNFLNETLSMMRSSVPRIDEAVLMAVRSLQVDNWVYLRDTKNYSIFVASSAESAFGVFGLTERIRDVVGKSGVVIETGLVRYRGRFVCDGLVSRVVNLGPGYLRSFRERYRALRTAGRFDVAYEA